MYDDVFPIYNHCDFMGVNYEIQIQNDPATCTQNGGGGGLLQFYISARFIYSVSTDFKSVENYFEIEEYTDEVLKKREFVVN